MNFEQVIGIVFLLAIIVASDKFEFVKNRTEKYKKVKELYLTLVGCALLAVIVFVIYKYWGDIDWFQGRGGNPYGLDDQY